MVKFFKDIKKVYGYKKILLSSLLLIFLITFIDEKNIISFLINKNYLWFIVLGFLMIIIYIFNLNLLKKIKSKSVNYLDVSLLVSFLSSIIYFIYLFLNSLVKYKFIALIVLSTLTFILIIIRLIILNKKDNYKSNVLDLKDIYDKKIDISSQEFALLEEKEVSYDLLNRKDIINQLYNTLINCNPARIMGYRENNNYK